MRVHPFSHIHKLHKIPGDFSSCTCVCMFVCMHVHTFIPIHKSHKNFWQLLPAYVCTCVCIYMCVCVYVYMCTYILPHPRTTQEFLATFTCVRAYVCMCVCVHVCFVCVCACVHIHSSTSTNHARISCNVSRVRR